MWWEGCHRTETLSWKWPEEKKGERVMRNGPANYSFQMNHTSVLGVYTHAPGCGPHGHVSMSVF